MSKWFRDFEYFFKRDERNGYLSIFGINILLITLLFYLAFAGIPKAPDLTDMYHIIIGALITLLATVLFEYGRDLARRKDLLWPYLEVLDDINNVIISILIDIKRAFPLKPDLIDEQYYKDLIDDHEKVIAESLKSLINSLKNLSDEQIYSNLNSIKLTEFCRHINMPYETLGRIYPMFLTIADLYSKEFISLTSTLYKSLQDIKRFCSYNADEIPSDIGKERFAKFIDSLIHLLEIILDLNLMIEKKIMRYEEYERPSR